MITNFARRMQARPQWLAVCALVSALVFAPGALAAPPHAAPKEVTHAEAAKEIGRGVMVATGSAMPASLMPLMREHALARDGKTDVFYMATFASEANFKDNVVAKWHPNLMFVSQGNRGVASHAAEGKATLHRASLYELGKKMERDELNIDTVVVRVSPPDAEGNVSLGSTGDLTMLAIQSVQRRGGKVIAEVNPNVPHMKGNRIPYSSLDYVIRSDELLGEANALVPMEAEKTIATNVANLIPNGKRVTLQVGIGNALAGMGDALKGKTMDIWSEMGSASVIALATGPHPIARTATFSFLHADNASYQAAAASPIIDIRSSTEVNNPEIIATKENMMAVNTALEVDLFGNVNAERDGDKVISFPGGQPDFMKGASLNPTGSAIMALRSTAGNKGGLSTIVMNLKGPTTTPKDNVDHVVTEWGATPRLRGQSDSFRAFHIIQVADPLARGELAKAAHEHGLLDQAQVEAISKSIYPAIHTAPADVREMLANHALEKGLISIDEHMQIVVELLTPKLGVAAR